MTLHVRPTIPADIPDLTNLLNYTIRVGGTTANEEEMTQDVFETHCVDPAVIIHTVLADHIVAGFQYVIAIDDGLSIASFTDQENPVRGAGSALFAATKAAAIAKGYPWIDAKIRADNRPGLAYYSKMGFEDYKTDYAIPLRDGTPVDRITKRILL
jgi:L-amino acid N-acyltransferase YncA